MKYADRKKDLFKITFMNRDKNMSNFFIINKLNEKIILTYFIRYYLNY
jgi:hypothetical protein